ncbi:MAG: chemotaxis protein CheC [Candidatus Eremiobacteraeota bacterium]|nr:chemotaxis protein CheC [Candidatus Eremiobacteraeota bacterium]MBV8370900.1 chemotaxis protein CheC [Candidatus Eremiobacteraeota bacterium]
MTMPALTLNELQRDALKEVGNIGAGHAATALSQLLNTTVKLAEPTIDVLKFRDLSQRMGSPERSVAALHMYIRGEAPGQMVVLFDREQAAEFVNVFIKRIIGDIQIFDSIVDSTLKELGNIIAGSYLTALISLTGINLLPSVPTLSYGTVQAAFRTLMSILPDQDVFLIESQFLDKDRAVSGQFILIPETGSLQPLLSVFGVND